MNMPTNALSKAEILVDEHTIDQAIQTVANDISAYIHQQKAQGNQAPWSLVCIMNGGLYFSGQLMKYCTQPVTIDYLHASRYGNAETGRSLNWAMEPTESQIIGKNIILLDDIFDEGITLETIHHECVKLKPASIISAVLVDKQHPRKPISGYQPHFIGLPVEDKFIFGCGMDYQGYWRNLPAIYAMKD